MRPVSVIAALLSLTALSPTALARPAPDRVTLTPLAADARAGRPLSLHIGGRVVEAGDASPARLRRQWPGTYFEGAFRGRAVDLVIGPGDVSLRVAIDGAAPVALVRPAPGLYRVTAPNAGTHRVRVDVVSESQAGPTDFGGIVAAPGTQPLAAPTYRARQIEFIGDSHTVGYGNTSAKRECSQDEVWATTDTARGVAGITAARYDADYRVNAISGRGIVRNYDDTPGATVPQAYPFALFDGQTPAQQGGWRPQLVVIALGTNDFSTPLKTGGRWPTRDALHADYEARYVAFVRMLRGRYPDAYFILWATDLSNGEIAQEASRVATRFKQEGERRVTFVPVNGLGFSGCHAHPDLADDRAIASAIGAAVDRQTGIWRKR